MTRNNKIQSIKIEDIHILNPRVRNKRVFADIVENITSVGLKRPITVTKSESPVEGKLYDLVCGQGRLEAFIECGYSEIPAIVIDADQEQALIMSLVENLARRQHRSMDLLKGVSVLHNKKYSAEKIAEKTGLTADYIRDIVKLLERGEERLIVGVESGKIPLNTAVKIALSPEDDQKALQDAYENEELRGAKFMKARRLVEARRRQGKTIRTGRKGRPRNKTSLSGRDVMNIYKKEVDRKRSITRKAEFVNTQLVFVVEALRQLYQEDHFTTLLKAEQIETLPKPIAEILTNRAERHV